MTCVMNPVHLAISLSDEPLTSQKHITSSIHIYIFLTYSELYTYHTSSSTITDAGTTDTKFKRHHVMDISHRIKFGKTQVW